jgi:Sulfotransferase family
VPYARRRVTGRDADTFFFVHVMKTAGTTFVQHVHANFRPEEVFPHPERGEARRQAYFLLDELRALPPERRRQIRAYTGHYPFVASRLVDATVTATLLREPVDRIVSTLKHCKRHDPRLADLPLEAIYDDGWVFPIYVHDHQVKMFAMTLDDKLESHLDVVAVDERRLTIAREHLAAVDLVGLSERYDHFVAAVQQRLGWTIGAVPNQRVSDEAWDVPRAFRRRIADDNAADLAFYEYAREIVAARAG